MMVTSGSTGSSVMPSGGGGGGGSGSRIWAAAGSARASSRIISERFMVGLRKMDAFYRRCGAGVRGRRGSQVEHQLVFLGQHLEAARLVVLEDRGDDLVGVVDDLHQVEVLGVDHALVDEAVAEPVEQALPERAVDEDHRDAAALARLDQRQHLEQLVE